MVADIRSGSDNSYPSDFIVFNNALYFEASDGTNGNELWKYDGNNAPSMVADINSGSGDSAPGYFFVFDNDLFFVAINEGDLGSLFRYSVESTITYS